MRDSTEAPSQWPPESPGADGESPPASPSPGAGPPRESYRRLFLRFLGFGLLAWGGPVAQIAMIRRELVERERWVSPDQFNRVFAVYQVLPGPEAHELCVYFGMLARGRLGGLLAGLGFMLPGFALMFLLSWLYVRTGGTMAVFAAAFYGMQPAVAALVVRAVHRIGRPVLRDRWLLAITAAVAASALGGVHFLISLTAAGVAYVAAQRGHRVVSAVVCVALVVTALAGSRGILTDLGPDGRGVIRAAREAPSILALLGSGLRTGLLTFGGAYTAIPFLRHDAVIRGGWMTSEQFLDGLALGGILPAPLIIFGTFVGYLGAGPWGALALTAGIFLPAFGFTLVAHEQIERLTAMPSVHAFLTGVTAGVVGLIAVTAVVLARDAITDLTQVAIGGAALAVLYSWHARLSVPAVVLGAGAAGWFLRAVS